MVSSSATLWYSDPVIPVGSTTLHFLNPFKLETAVLKGECLGQEPVCWNNENERGSKAVLSCLSLCAFQFSVHTSEGAFPLSSLFHSPSHLFHQLFFSWAAELRSRAQQHVSEAVLDDHSGQPGYSSSFPMHREVVDSDTQGLNEPCQSSSGQTQAATTVWTAKSQVRIGCVPLGQECCLSMAFVERYRPLSYPTKPPQWCPFGFRPSLIFCGAQRTWMGWAGRGGATVNPYYHLSSVFSRELVNGTTASPGGLKAGREVYFPRFTPKSSYPSSSAQPRMILLLAEIFVVMRLTASVSRNKKAKLPVLVNSGDELYVSQTQGCLSHI